MRLRSVTLGWAVLASGCAATGATKSEPAREPVASVSPAAPEVAAAVEAPPPSPPAPERPKKPAPKPFRFTRPVANATAISAFPSRADVSEPQPIDLDALPLAAEGPAGAALASFHVRRLDLTAQYCAPGSYATPRVTWATDVFTGAPLVVRIGGLTLPATRFLDGQHSDYTLEPLASAEPGEQLRPAMWATLSPARSRAEADVTSFAGSFDPNSGRVAARSKTTATAAAIAEGALYAFRACEAGCDEPPGSSAHRERLTIVGPPAVWVGASDDPGGQMLARREAFTLLTAPLRRGASATLDLVALDGDVDRFAKHAPPLGARDLAGQKRWTTYSIDVVWPDDAAAPSASLFVSHVSGSPERLRPDLETVFAEPFVSGPSACSRIDRIPEPDPLEAGF